MHDGAAARPQQERPQAVLAGLLGRLQETVEQADWVVACS